MKRIQINGCFLLLCFCFLSVSTVFSFTSSLENVPEGKRDLYRLRKQFPLVCNEVTDLDWKDSERMVGLIKVRATEVLDKKEAILFSKYVHAWASAAILKHPEGAHFNEYMDAILENGVITRIPKLVYSDYGMVRQIPFHLLAALPACSDEQKSRLIEVIKQVVEFDRLHQGEAIIRQNVNTDYMYNMLPHLFFCALYQPDENLAVRDMKAFSDYLSACTQYTCGDRDGLKVDGTGFHHRTHYNGYMYAYKTWVEYMYRLRGTSFKIQVDAYRRMKKAVVSEYLMATLPTSGDAHYFANSMAGRHPFAGLKVDFGAELFRNLIEIGGDLEGKEIDEDLAAYYNAFFETNYYKGIRPHKLDGFYQFNYSPAAVYRYDNWVATMRCPTTRFWGGELYSGTNRFGRYQSHGTLEIMYDGSLKKSGYPDGWERFSGERGGWDWNVIPGATTVHYTNWNEMLPNKDNTSRFDQWAKTTNFSGALSWGDCGIFAASFDQGDYWGGRRFEPTNLSFCKSVFAFDGILVSMGSGIGSYGNYSDDWITATNLFQAIDYKENKTPVVNGKKLKKGESLILYNDKNNWLITPCSTGYIIPSGNDPLQVSYKDQYTPGPEGITDSSFGTLCATKAYFNHGIKPIRKKYCFAVVPTATPKRMSTYARQLFCKENGAFDVRQHQDSLHVLKHIASNTLAYALFAPAKFLQEGMLCSVDSPLLLMERAEPENEILKLAVCSPDLRPEMTEDGKKWHSVPTVSTLILRGGWKLTGSFPKGVSSCSKVGNNTELVLILKDGLPLYITLKSEE
ncbi:chondroitinase [Bacteroides sp. K03]|uniref:chondroitinase family polysaccharide lyase n=1 Tax=Bacteroides sp. K03 TaxID=2718928 RepID=UPI001C8CA0DC|nr:chondroitinase family polysaccharide lyase [Bacteroides sp. K03]MBX9187172.1 chondroitinase [Bacteroides sp. K03]